jgi:SAM-dependent methyltransferase
MRVDWVRCALCGSTESKPIAAGTDREYRTTIEHFCAVACAGCGFVYLNPRPAECELGTIYPKTYHSYVIGDGLTAKMRRMAGRWRMARALGHYYPKRPRLLDIGCGNGWLLDVFKDLRPDMVTAGVDIDEQACRAARERGHLAHTGRFEDIDWQGHYDIINLTHVIEHLSDPVAVMRRAAGLLSTGGIMVIETPNIGALDHRWFRNTWGAYHFPRHWSFFDAEHLDRAAADCGLERADLYYLPAPTHWVWTLHNLTGWWLFDPTAIFKAKLWPAVLLAGFYLLDRLILACGAQTSVMTAVYRLRAESVPKIQG